MVEGILVANFLKMNSKNILNLMSLTSKMSLLIKHYHLHIEDCEAIETLSNLFLCLAKKKWLSY